MRDPLAPHIELLSKTTDPWQRAGLLLVMSRLTADRALAADRAYNGHAVTAFNDRVTGLWWTAATYLLLADVEHAVARSGKPTWGRMFTGHLSNGGDRDRLLTPWVNALTSDRVTNVLYQMTGHRDLGDRSRMLGDLRGPMTAVIGHRSWVDDILVTVGSPGHFGWRPVTRIQEFVTRKHRRRDPAVIPYVKGLAALAGAAMLTYGQVATNYFLGLIGMGIALLAAFSLLDDVRTRTGEMLAGDAASRAAAELGAPAE